MKKTCSKLLKIRQSVLTAALKIPENGNLIKVCRYFQSLVYVAYENSRSSKLCLYGLHILSHEVSKLSLPRRQHRTKTIPRNLPFPIHLLQHKKLLIRLLNYLPRRLNLRTPSRTRAGKRPFVIEDFDFMDGKAWR